MKFQDGEDVDVRRGLVFMHYQWVWILKSSGNSKEHTDMCRVTNLKLIVFFSTRSTTISGVGQSKINWITAQLFNTGLMTYMSLILWVYNSKRYFLKQWHHG